jgi:hypothetical protein
VKRTRDCISLTKERLLEAGWATDADIKAIDKAVRKRVDEEMKEAQVGGAIALIMTFICIVCLHSGARTQISQIVQLLRFYFYYRRRPSWT